MATAKVTAWRPKFNCWRADMRYNAPFAVAALAPLCSPARATTRGSDFQHHLCISEASCGRAGHGGHNGCQCAVSIFCREAEFPRYSSADYQAPSGDVARKRPSEPFCRADAAYPADSLRNFYKKSLGGKSGHSCAPIGKQRRSLRACQEET